MSGTRRAGVTIDGQTYRVYVPPKSGPKGSEGWDSAIANVPIQTKDVQIAQPDWSGGFGYSWMTPQTPRNAYAWAEPGYCRDPFLFCPPGRIQQLTMPVNVTVAVATAPSRAPIAGRDWQNSDGTTDFYFTVGEFICKDVRGTGSLTDVYYGGEPAGSHNVQFVSAEIFDDGSGGSCMLFGCYTGATINTDQQTVVKWDGSAFSRPLGAVGAKIAMMKTCYLSPGGSIVDYGLGGGTLGVGTNYLIAADSRTTSPPNMIRAVAKGSDPTLAASYATWGTVGPNNKYGIASLIGSRQHFYVVKPDGLFDWTELGESIPLTNWWNDALDLNNGICAQFFDGGILASHVMGLNWMSVSDSVPRQDKPEWVTPGYKTGNETPVVGRYTAMCQAGGDVYAACTTASGTYIMVGSVREPGDPGPGRFKWHGAEAYLAGVSVSMIALSNASGRPMLYYGGVAHSDGVTPVLYRQYLAKGGGPLQDLLYGSSSFQFHESAKLYTPIQTWNYPGAPKLVQTFDVQADGLTTDSFAEVFAAMDLTHAYDTSSYITQGKVSEAPGSTLFSDDGTGTTDAAGAFLFGRHLSTRIDLTGTPTAPVRLRNLMTIGSIRVQTWAEETFQFEITEAMPANELSLSRDDMEYAYQHLVSLQDGAEVALTSLFGQEFTVLVQGGSVTKGWALAPDGKFVVGTVSVRVRYLMHPMHADLGDRSDSAGRAS